MAGSGDQGSGLVALVDVDGTLYPTDTRMHAVLEHRHVEAVAHFLGISLAEVQPLRADVMARGGPLRYVVDEHGVAPAEYLSFICGDETDPRKHLAPDPALRAVLERATARLFLFSNAPTIHCERVTEALGVRDLFEGVFEMSQVEWRGKPEPPIYERALATLGMEADRFTSVDDDRSALDTAARLGMRTVCVGKGAATSHATIAGLHALESGAPWLFA